MSYPECTEYELATFAEHELDLKEEKMSISQAIKDFGLDKLTRPKLEYEAARNLLELNNLVNRVNLLSMSQKRRLLETWGLLNGSPTGIFKKALENSKHRARSEFSSMGGDGKSKKYEPLRELAKYLVSTKPFKSRRNAAITIKPEIIAKGKEIGVVLSEDQAVDTIIGWLTDMGLPAKA